MARAWAGALVWPGPGPGPFHGPGPGAQGHAKLTIKSLYTLFLELFTTFSLNNVVFFFKATITF